MAYLRLKDYYNLIQDQNLQQVIRGDDSLRLSSQKTAQDEVASYLIQKYDLSAEFTDLLQYNATATYQAHQLVDLNFTPYSASNIYAVNDTTLNNGLSYICHTAISIPEPFNPAHWTFLGNQYDLFYIPFPYPKFDYQAFYNIGDIVFWKGKIYQCAKQSVLLDHTSTLQYSTYANIPFINTFPDTLVTGQQQWGIGVPYSILGLLVNAVPGNFTAWSSLTTYVAGNKVSFNSQIWQAIANSTNVTPGTDITKWQPISWISGDDRSSQLVQRMIDITLYHLHSGISPKNIPDLRVKRYDDALEWLKDCAKGNVTLDSPLIQPIRGNRIRYGGNIKNVNGY